MPSARSSENGTASAVLVDAHVHFHPAFEESRFLKASARNLDRAAHELRVDRPGPGVLLVMETGQPSYVQTLRRRAGDAGREPGSWTFHLTEERASVLAMRDGEPSLILIEGRQLVTREGLEVLASPCEMDLPAGMPLPETVAAIRESGALPLLPWGFGKWTARRGRAVRATLERQRPGSLLVADNGGRASVSWMPSLLTLAAQRGFGVLRGSDPLPLAREARRAGSYGSLLRGELDPAWPAAGMRRLLSAVEGQPQQFGRRVGLAAFAVNQLAMQLRRGAA